MYSPVSDTNKSIHVFGRTGGVPKHDSFLPRKELQVSHARFFYHGRMVTRLHRIFKLCLDSLCQYCLHCVVYIFDNRQGQFVTLSRAILFPPDFEREIHTLVEVLVCVRSIIYRTRCSGEEKACIIVAILFNIHFEIFLR